MTPKDIPISCSNKHFLLNEQSNTWNLFWPPGGLLNMHQEIWWSKHREYSLLTNSKKKKSTKQLQLTGADYLYWGRPSSLFNITALWDASSITHKFTQETWYMGMDNHTPHLKKYWAHCQRISTTMIWSPGSLTNMCALHQSFYCSATVSW